MKYKKIYMWFFFALTSNLALADEENVMLTPNSTSDPDQGEYLERPFSTSASENVPEPIGLPKPMNPKSHHHKQREHLENVQSHRSPVYEVVSQPCYSYGCRGYGQQESGYQPWQSKGNRFVPYPQPVYEPRRRGAYPPPEYYPDGYYGPREPDYGYGPRARPIYPQSQGRYGYGEYSQPNFGNNFLG